MNKKLILAETELAQWHRLVRDAEADYGCHLDETMQSYLVFTLMRFMKDHNLNRHALALDFLQSQSLPYSARLDRLRDIGDQCLLLSGLYPRRAGKRLVGVGYYVNLGRSAYRHIGAFAQKGVAELYDQLEETFVLLMDLLQTIRQYNAPALQPLSAFQQWQDTGSQHAFRQLSAHGLPLAGNLIDTDHRH